MSRDDSSGLFRCCKCHLGSRKATKKKILRGGKNTRQDTEGEKSTKEKEKKVLSEAVRHPPPKKRIQVARSAEKLIQLGRTSQQRHVGFERSTPSSEKAPFSRSPSLHVLSHAGVRASEGSLKVIPCELSVRGAQRERESNNNNHFHHHLPRFGRTHTHTHAHTARTHGACIRGVPHRMDERCAETERLAPLPLAQTLPRRPVGRPQLP